MVWSLHRATKGFSSERESDKWTRTSCLINREYVSVALGTVSASLAEATRVKGLMAKVILEQGPIPRVTGRKDDSAYQVPLHSGRHSSVGIARAQAAANDGRHV